MIIDLVRSPRYFVHKENRLFEDPFIRYAPYYIRYYDDMTWECVYLDGYIQRNSNPEETLKNPEKLWLEISGSSLRSLLESAVQATCPSCGRADYRCLSRGICILKPY